MSLPTPPLRSESTNSANHIRVMVVDDSLVIRGLISRVLKEDPHIDIVASVSNGEKAVERVRQGDVDVVVLDIEMPVMDGLTALPLMLKEQPDLVVIMASTLTTRNANVSLQALKAGATDYIPKPTSNKDLFNAEDFRRELIGKVKALGGAAKRTKLAGAQTAARGATSAGSVKLPFELRAQSPVSPRVVAIASSTGGPIALQKALEQIGPGLRVPIVITQHMPPMFTGLLATNLARETGIPCKEAETGDLLVPGQALIAPGDHHMLVKRDGNSVRVVLTQGPPENFCRPAADPMYRSLIDVYRSSILAVVLTGMGSDGEKGCRAVADAGGTVIAQDEATSVVWGMPAAVARANICHAVLPIQQIGAKVKSIVGG